MANRRFTSQFRYSFEKMPVDLFLKAAIGATGAVTLSASESTGIATMTRTSAGLYVITCQDQYAELLDISAMQTLAGATCLAAPTMKVTSFVNTTGVAVITVQFQAPSAGGTNSVPTFTGTPATPAGTISRGNIPVATGTAGQAVTNNAGTLNSSGGEDLTVDLQTFTGTPATPAGTVSAPTFTATAAAVADPDNGVTLRIRMTLRNS